MNFLKDTINRGSKEQIITYSVVLTVLFYIFRSSIPVFKYPFILLFFGTLGYSLIVIKNRIIPTLSDFFRNYYLIILTTIILICSFLLSRKVYLIIFKDCLNSIILVSSAFMMSVLINTRQGANSFYNGVVKSIVYFAVFISVDSLCKVFNIFTVNPIINTEASLLVHKNIDYNFAVLPVVLGMVGALYLVAKTKSSFSRITCNCFLILFSIVIVLSGSRRGVFVFAFLLFIILIAQILAFSKKSGFLKDLGLATRIYVLSSVLLSVIIYFLIIGTSYQFKNRALKATGSKNILSAKITIASKIYKYYTLFSTRMIFTDFYGRFWSAEFNPYDPESGWGMRMHKIVFPLTGKNVEMIPEGVKGYLMDSTCNSDTWGGHAYSYTAVKRNFEIEETDLIDASVYCYMSEDFNGSWARVIGGGAKMGTVDGFDYDTTKKGTWQKLTCQMANVKDKITVAFYFSKINSIDFSDLKGYIIFAYPQIEIIRTKFNPLDPKRGGGKPPHKLVFPLSGKNVEIVPDGVKGYLIDSTCFAGSWGGNAYSYTTIDRNIHIKENQLLNISVFCYMSEDFNGSWARILCGARLKGTVNGIEYDHAKKGTWQKLTCKVFYIKDTVDIAFYLSKMGASDFMDLKGYLIFASPEVEIVNHEYDPLDPDNGWGERIHKTVFPLTGKNVGIVPSEAKGYLMDRSCNADTWNGDAFSYTSIKGNIDITENKLLEVSVFCYMSEDFDGSWARIICGGKKTGTIDGLNYDTLKKGTWQKLTCKISGVNDKIDAAFYFCKTGVINFSDLKGYIIFAYPQVEIVNHEYDPSNPDTGWSNRIHKIVFPLTGKNVEIVPSSAKGYLMDRSCNADTWNGDAYSYTVIKNNIDISENKILEVSVFCYMSEDFNGSWARIICGGLKTGTSDGLNYDTLKKGTWQKLTCTISKVTDKIKPTFYFCKTGVKDFSDLQGYIIFAYPFYEIREDKIKDLSNLIWKTAPNHYSRATYGNFAIPFFTGLLQNQKEKELIRDLASRIISEDTTYYAYRNDLKVSDANNDFVGLRFAHWKFAREIYLKEYNLKQKIFGGGFSFLNWYSYYFSGDKIKYDYPHNPFLSVLLYSGILGLMIYLLLFYKVISYYIRYRKEYPVLIYLFLVAFFFSFFSGGSPLDPPIMGFFVILPFVLHYIHMKEPGTSLGS